MAHVARNCSHRSDHAYGFSLVELLVALAIGIFLLAGALTIFQQTRTQYRSIEAVSRLQESARYAMSVIENDLRLAGYWAKHSRADSVSGDDAVTDLALCDPDFDPTADNLGVYVAGGGTITLDCAVNPRAASDVLVVRRLSVDPVPPEEAKDETTEPDLAGNVIYAQTSYVGTLAFQDDAVPLPYFSDTSDTHFFVTDAYYVRNGSDTDPGIPSLRRISLVAGPGVQDTEVATGIENLDVTFGLDTNADGTVDTWTDDAAAIAADPPLAAQITVAARAEQREPGVAPDGFRRFNLTKTIYLRNQRR
jgi:type IV pilus assembly protein PilW